MSMYFVVSEEFISFVQHVSRCYAAAYFGFNFQCFDFSKKINIDHIEFSFQELFRGIYSLPNKLTQYS